MDQPPFRTWHWPTTALAVLVALVVLLGTISRAGHVQAQTVTPENFVVTGQLVDAQGQPVAGAEVSAYSPDEEEALATIESQEDGGWSLVIDDLPPRELVIGVERPHLEEASFTIADEELLSLAATGSYRLGAVGLVRHIGVGFWAAAIIFVAMLALIAAEKLHSTTAALAGLSAVFLVTFVGGLFNPDFYIFDFERALTYVNWEVIFLLIGMMVIIAIIEHTGIFQWTAFQAYRLSRGRAWLLVLILMGVTAVASALLDNFTTMLLMTPISLQIGLALGINPLALIIPEVLASNVGGSVP
jgi:hypothetical protein